MKSYLLWINEQQPIAVNSLKEGDSLTPTAQFLRFIYDEEDDLYALEIEVDRGVGIYRGSPKKKLWVRPGRPEYYVYFASASDCKGETYWFGLYEDSKEPRLLFELNAERDGYLCVGLASTCECVTIPKEYQGLKVRGLADGVFARTPFLKKVTLSPYIEEIPREAFLGCVNLEEVHIQSLLLHHIGYLAFAYCKILKEIAFPEYVGELDARAFEKSGLIRIEFPSYFFIVPDRAFSGCKNLKEAILPSGIKELEDHCFADTSIMKIGIPASIRKVAEDAFSDGAPIDIYFEGKVSDWPTSIKKMREASSKINAIHCYDGNIE